MEVISKLPKVGRFLRNRRLRTDGSESHPYLEFVNFEIGSMIKTLKHRSSMKRRRFRSAGHCKLCGKNIEGGKISSHLLECREKLSAREGESPVTMMQISVKGKHNPEYWLQIAVWNGAKLSDIDDFLRAAWLECCGHLSMFRINGERFKSELEPANIRMFSLGNLPKSMSIKLHKVLEPGTVFEHDYDFGSTTQLELEVLDVFRATKPSKTVTLLAHNLSPKIKCETCGEDATQICASCFELSCLCDECGTKHKCGEDMLMPLVNSPRVGVCGYCGPVRL